MDLQRANSWKRIAAWMLDLMLLSVLAVGAALGISTMSGYDGYYQTVQNAYDSYEAQYGIELDIDKETYDAMTPQEQAEYQKTLETIQKDLNADQEVRKAYDMVVTLMVLSATLGILAATLVLEFAVPLILKNGRTVGKMCFGVGVVRIDGVKISALQLFVRTLLGKYTIEIMVPVYIILMIFWGSLNIIGLVVIALLLILQIVCVAVSRDRAAIHDRLAGTVVVDITSQKVFATAQERVDYINRIHEEQAKKQDY